jgi:hypothetical protein
MLHLGRHIQGDEGDFSEEGEHRSIHRAAAPPPSILLPEWPTNAATNFRNMGKAA